MLKGGTTMSRLALTWTPPKGFLNPFGSVDERRLEDAAN